ncbi:TPA: hypothetical protein N0F65_008190 [Lagenidium giganteum]|uniref:Nickel/cobalt efflux system n=1 Tax=Lagenidium giganteum TaxID=4803 RepID=A0AAV2YER5_9STRA|nr:TPA: hypothetical protein N0F65_008190 [Lagenidium giganteum]
MMRRRPMRLIAALVLVNIVLWCAVLVVAKSHPVLMSPAVLAYTLGLRHAVDADHIAAIDNVTRKFMNEGRKPLTIGLFFSLGHSTVVILLTVGLVFSSKFISDHLDSSKEIGSIIGTTVSAFFLVLIGLINLRVLKQSYEDWKAIRRGEALPSQEETERLAREGEAMTSSPQTPKGFAAICCPCAFKVIDAPWKMYPLGLLFGLGFDTASEIALLGISVMTSKQEDLPTSVVLLLPLLFTAGMTLIDTLDGIFMLWAYGWAFINPAKKTLYNMFLTGTSAFVAFFVGGIEACGILVEHFHIQGKFWAGIHDLSEDFEALGFVIIGIFVVAFLISYLMYRCSPVANAGNSHEVQPLMQPLIARGQSAQETAVPA